MDSRKIQELLRIANEALKNSYAPYSGYRVGAALLTKTGKVYTGANIENASYGLTICAERVALFNAVNEGEREFIAIAIVSDDPSTPPFPCGACRQVLAEFSPSMEIIIKKGDEVIIKNLKELLPYSFDFK